MAVEWKKIVLEADLSGYLTTATADDTYLKLDGTNDPVTGEVQFDADVKIKSGQKLILDAS